MAKTNAQLQKELRDRRRDAGWVKIWIPSEIKKSALWKQLMALIESYKG